MAWLPRWLKVESQDSDNIQHDTHSEAPSQSTRGPSTRRESTTQSILRQSIDHEISQQRQTWQEAPQGSPITSKWRDSISSTCSSSSSIHSRHKEPHTPRCLTPVHFSSSHRSPVIRRMASRGQTDDRLDMKGFENISLSDTREDKMRLIRERKKMKREEERRSRDPERYWNILE